MKRLKKAVKIAIFMLIAKSLHGIDNSFNLAYDCVFYFCMHRAWWYQVNMLILIACIVILIYMDSEVGVW